MLEPKFAILDEIDSGLDIDALKVVSKGVNAIRGENFGALIITHYQRLLNYITPDVVHVMMEGRVVMMMPLLLIIKMVRRQLWSLLTSIKRRTIR